MARGSKPGERRGGRKAGVPNRFTADLREAINAAFQQAGGVDYLIGVAKKNPAVFCALIGKVIPAQVEHSGQLTLASLIAQSMSDPEKSDK